MMLNMVIAISMLLANHQNMVSNIANPPEIMVMRLLLLKISLKQSILGTMENAGKLLATKPKFLT